MSYAPRTRAAPARGPKTRWGRHGVSAPRLQNGKRSESLVLQTAHARNACFHESPQPLCCRPEPGCSSGAARKDAEPESVPRKASSRTVASVPQALMRRRRMLWPRPDPASDCRPPPKIQAGEFWAIHPPPALGPLFPPLHTTSIIELTPSTSPAENLQSRPPKCAHKARRRCPASQARARTTAAGRMRLPTSPWGLAPWEPAGGAASSRLPWMSAGGGSAAA